MVALAFLDFLYCILILPVYSQLYLDKRWVLGPEICVVWAAMVYAISNGSLMGTALVALTRLLRLTCPNVGRLWSSAKMAVFAVTLLMSYSTALVVPTLLEVRQSSKNVYFKKY